MRNRTRFLVVGGLLALIVTIVVLTRRARVRPAEDERTDPNRYLQGEASTLQQVLVQCEAEGYGSQFGAHEGGAVFCYTCRRTTPASDLTVHSLTRLEGASDPADMLVVVAGRCPHCSNAGTLVLNFGPEATLEQSEVLAELREPIETRTPATAPPR